MAVDLDKARERASEQATNWLILLQDDPDDADQLRRFDAWLAESPLHVEAWAVTDRVAGGLGRMPPVFAERWRPLLEAHQAGQTITPLSASVPNVRRGTRARSTHLVYRVGFGIAGAAVAACLAFVIMPDAMLHLRADYMTGTAETRSVALADGSDVVLAPDSAIRVAYADGERRVELLSGEAFFTVVHDAAKPFRVAVGGIETTDLGTAFDVRKGDDDATIAVQQGSVRVDYRSATPPVSETLGAGQSMRVTWAGQAVHGDEPPTQIAAWRQRQLIAQDSPMAEVVDQLRPYFAGKIIVTNAALAGQKVTGVYNLTDPVNALRAIATARGATVHRITPWILVVTGG